MRRGWWARVRLLAVPVLAVAGLVVSGLAMPVAASGPSRPRPVAVRRPLQTPVFSLRRLPVLLRQRVADERLAAAVAQVVGGAAGPRICVDVRDETGRQLYGLATAERLIPASTLKILTARGVLAGLGPESRLRTEVKGGPPAEGAVGDLWLVGGGDPLLSTAQFALEAGFGGKPRLATSLESLADAVTAAGVGRVVRLIGDDSRHEATRVLPGWSSTYAAMLAITPLSALTVNKGLLLGNRSAAPSPALEATATLAALLEARGVVVDQVGEGVAPANAPVLAAIESAPMADVVGEILQNSDNLGAELLIRELARRDAATGTTAAGTAGVRNELSRDGVDLTQLVVADGSGLDRANRASCRVITDVLLADGSAGDIGSALPVAGRQGTMLNRLAGTPAEGRVRAKTGSLQGVAGLAGWATGPDHQAIAFSALVNMPSPGGSASSDAAVELVDKVALAVAAYPDAPDLESISPESRGRE